MTNAIHLANVRVLAAHTALDAIALTDAIAVRDALLAAHEQIAALTAEMDLLRAQCQEHELRRNQANARAGTLNCRVQKLTRELENLTADEPKIMPDFLELHRIDRYLRALFRTDRDDDAVLANRMLNYLGELIAEVARVRPNIGQEAA